MHAVADFVQRMILSRIKNLYTLYLQLLMNPMSSLTMRRYKQQKEAYKPPRLQNRDSFAWDLDTNNASNQQSDNIFRNSEGQITPASEMTPKKPFLGRCQSYCKQQPITWIYQS